MCACACVGGRGYIARETRQRESKRKDSVDRTQADTAGVIPNAARCRGRTHLPLALRHDHQPGGALGTGLGIVES